MQFYDVSVHRDLVKSLLSHFLTRISFHMLFNDLFILIIPFVKRLIWVIDNWHNAFQAFLPLCLTVAMITRAWNKFNRKFLVIGYAFVPSRNILPFVQTENLLSVLKWNVFCVHFFPKTDDILFSTPVDGNINQSFFS
jgi:hypothetical protein